MLGGGCRHRSTWWWPSVTSHYLSSTVKPFNSSSISFFFSYPLVHHPQTTTSTLDPDDTPQIQPLPNLSPPPPLSRAELPYVEGGQCPPTLKFIGVEKSMRKAKKNIGSKNGLEKACKSGDFTKKEECEAEKRSYSHQIGANLDSMER
ncbi:hypothetical protein PIB30_050611 [Stylosanthes scabra]|uniref:Uncharacterized protein n=1 Tax=Stylosanthes scabra TaxID=79078 RepID=A0ABU6XJ12_9FABA|nr:hypothetical protein [Stylosanthes scabra]